MKNLQDFQIISQLAQGSYATVYKAMHIPTQKLYALKEMSKAKLIHSQKTEAAVQERKIHSSLQHPGIVQFISSFQSAQFLYIVLELTECGDLLTATNLKGLSISAVCEQILQALFYLHNVARVVHLDLKPENILLFPNGVVKICDFGCAQWIDEAENRGKKRNLGTVEYACPHLLRGEWQEVGFGCDLWSFGCVVWFLLERARSFGEEVRGKCGQVRDGCREVEGTVGELEGTEKGKSEGNRATEEETSENRATEEEPSDNRSTETTTSENRATEEHTKISTEAAAVEPSTINSPIPTETIYKSIATETTDKPLSTEKTSNSIHSLQPVHPFSAASEYLSMKKVLEFDQARKKTPGERQILIGVDFDEVVFGHLDLTEERIGAIVALLSALSPEWEVGV